MEWLDAMLAIGQDELLPFTAELLEMLLGLMAHTYVFMCLVHACKYVCMYICIMYVCMLAIGQDELLPFTAELLEMLLGLMAHTYVSICMHANMCACKYALCMYACLL